MARRALLVCVLVLATAGAAHAHAVPLHIEPPSGSTLLTAPTDVFVTFDSPVRVGPRNAAIRNDGQNVLAGSPHVEHGNRLVMPLRASLTSGNYSVRWSIVSDDGHEEEGVIAFAIGAGGRPVAVLTTRGYVTWQRVIMRALFLLGVLGAGGTAFFSIAVLGGSLPRREAHLLFGCFLLAFVGADALIHATSASGTRFEKFMIVAAVASGIGAAASALAPLGAWLRWIVWAAAGVLFLCPTLAGHALDAGQPAVIAPAADLLHLGGAAIWLGGVASLALARVGTVERFATYALPAVAIVAIGGAARALTELSSFSQLWTTSYGRTLVVKTALFLVLLGVVWLARRRLLLVQLLLLTLLMVAVGTLTDLRPGEARSAVTVTPSNVPPPPPAPPVGAYVDAAQAGKLAVGFAWRRGKPTVTLIGPDGAEVTNVPVTVRPAGRTVIVKVGGKRIRFVVPATLRSGAALLRQATRAYNAADAVTIDERLASSPQNYQVSVLHERVPDRLAYTIVAASRPGLAGTQGVVIGNRRWSRAPGGEWRLSSQARLSVPHTYWSARARNAYFSGPRELTFYDPLVRAYYRLRVDAAGRPAKLKMTGAAHFMHHAYSFRSPRISAPSR